MNTYIERIGKSASMELIEKAKKMKEAGEDVIGLGGGEPDFDTPQPIKDKAIEELLKGNTHYAIGKGLPALREKIAEKLLFDNGIDVSSEDIIVTPGAKMAIYLSVRACINEGNEVLIPTPSWVSYTEIVKSCGGIPVEVPLNPEDNYYLSKKSLELYTSAKTKLIILCSPNNPTGRMYSKNEIMELLSFVQEKDITIISDEVYEKIYYKNKPISPAGFDGLKDITLTVNGFSKAYAMTGWRLGYVAGPQKYIRIINKLFTHTITGTSPFIQEAAIVAFDCNEYVERMRAEYSQRKNYFIQSLNSIPGVTCLTPDGAFYAWCKFDVKGSVADKLLNNAKVIGVPGIAYGKGFDQYIRFSFASSIDELEEATKRIEYFMRGSVG